MIRVAKLALLVLLLLLAACATSVTDRKMRKAGCAVAYFLGPVIGIPIAVSCALYDDEDEYGDVKGGPG